LIKSEIFWRNVFFEILTKFSGLDGFCVSFSLESCDLGHRYSQLAVYSFEIRDPSELFGCRNGGLCSGTSYLVLNGDESTVSEVN